MTRRICVCGIGTDVGKTLVSAILVQALSAHYWKPVQAGNLHNSDSQRIQELVKGVICYPEAYRLAHPISPHHAAALEGIVIHHHEFKIPQPDCSLVIEPAGGVLVPINQQDLLIDRFVEWKCEWIVVSRHYVGSINHTLLSLEALQRRNLQLKGIIFNGSDQPATEQFILSYTGLKCLGHLYPEEEIHSSTIQRYASRWKPYL